MKDVNTKKFIHFIAYFAVVFISVALVLSYAFKGTLADLANIFQVVANAMAYTIAAIFAFFYARSKRSVWYTIIYVVALILIIIFMFLPLFS